MQDRTAPVIELAWPVEMTQEAGVEFMDPGFVATDIVDGDVTSAVHVEGVIDVQKQSQEMKYSVSDSSGNSSMIALRTVTVEIPASGYSTDW